LLDIEVGHLRLNLRLLSSALLLLLLLGVVEVDLPTGTQSPRTLPAPPTTPERYVPTSSKKTSISGERLSAPYPRAKIPYLHQSDIGFEDSSSSDTESCSSDSDNSFIMHYIPLPSGPASRLNTPQAPNLRHPGRPLGMSLRNRKSGRL